MLSVPGLVARPFQTLFKSYKTKFESNLILASYQILHSCFLVTCITVWWSHLTVVGIPKYQARWQSVLVLDIKAVSSPDLIWCVYRFQYTTCGTESNSCWGWFFGTYTGSSMMRSGKEAESGKIFQSAHKASN